MPIRHPNSFTLLNILAVSMALPAAQAASYNFDQDLQLPSGWQIDATGGQAADWQVVTDHSATSKPNSLRITRIHERSRVNFNLFWSPATGFKNGSIEARIRADNGSVDQGGGLIWRVSDSNNYYITRYNPLENNLRLYIVKDGARKMLYDVPNIHIASKTWFLLKVTHHDNKIQVFLNGQPLITFSDNTFMQAGGVGLWAKADALTSFDDIHIESAD